MIEKPEQNKTVFDKFRWLMTSRVVIVSFMLGMATFIEIKGGQFYAEMSLPSLLPIILSFYGFVIVYLIVARLVDSLRVNLYVQTIGDISLITGLVYVTGGISSIYSVFYPLVIIYATIYLGKRGGVIIASTCSIFYGLLLDLEYYGIITTSSQVVSDGFYSGAGHVFARIFIHILSFYLVALLASFLVEREKRTRTLLEEKETAFNQLDLLHRSIIESVNAGILTVNLQGTIKSFNAAAVEITGYRREEVEGKDICELFPPFRNLQNTSIRSGTGPTGKMRTELSFIDKKGRNMIIGCSLSPLKDSRGTRIGDILIFQDLTNLKIMEEEMERNKRLAFIGEMAAGLAHELRNPLASMSGSIQMLRRDLKLRESDERLMQIVLRGKDQLEQLLRDFLVLARPARGSREWMDLRDAVADVAESIRYVSDWHEGITISTSFGDTTTLFANRGEMRQILWNLTLNAIQAMPDGGSVTVDVETLSVQSRDDTIRIALADSGCGIERHHLEKILEPFYTTKDTGTGLGLAIANRIVEGYGGQMRIVSNPEQGTTCTVILPRREENPGHM
jgi:two-component system, NtrC family, sensor histidine kinase PilS